MNTITLTPRQQQIAEHLADGFIDKEISDRLNVSYETVRTHRKNIYAKTGARNLADLTRWVFKIERSAVSAIFLLALVVSMELFHIDALRARRVKITKTTKISRRAKSKLKTYEL